VIQSAKLKGAGWGKLASDGSVYALCYWDDDDTAKAHATIEFVDGRWSWKIAGKLGGEVGTAEDLESAIGAAEAAIEAQAQ
jgi:hypothetical protein